MPAVKKIARIYRKYRHLRITPVLYWYTLYRYKVTIPVQERLAHDHKCAAPNRVVAILVPLLALLRSYRWLCGRAACGRRATSPASWYVCNPLQPTPVTTSLSGKPWPGAVRPTALRVSLRQARGYSPMRGSPHCWWHASNPWGPHVWTRGHPASSWVRVQACRGAERSRRWWHHAHARGPHTRHPRRPSEKHGWRGAHHCGVSHAQLRSTSHWIRYRRPGLPPPPSQRVCRRHRTPHHVRIHGGVASRGHAKVVWCA
jgi:hypothetical protein